MPTYNWRCETCKRDFEVVRSISEHCANPRPFVCCGAAAERYFPPLQCSIAVHYALAGDRHYDGLRATDGTDISTRTKHRAYMKANNLAMADDFKDTWAEAAKRREAYRRGEPGTGAITRNEIAMEVQRHLDTHR